MWWLLVPAVVGGIAWAASRTTPSSPPRSTPRDGPRVDPAQILVHNLVRLRHQLRAQQNLPRVLVVGLGGAGKSSLVDALTLEACSPRPTVGIETDATDWSRDADTPVTLLWGDVLVVDVPGYGTERHPADFFAQHLPFGLADVVLFVVAGKIMADDAAVFRAAVEGAGDRVWLVRTKVDVVPVATSQQITQAAVAGLSAPASQSRFAVSVCDGQGVEDLRCALADAIQAARLRRSA